MGNSWTGDRWEWVDLINFLKKALKIVRRMPKEQS